MAVLSLTSPSQAGANDAFTAAASGGDSFPLPQPILVRIRNTSGANRTVTFAAQKACNHGFTHNAAVGPIPTGETWTVRVADLTRFADVNGRVQMTYDSEVGLAVQAFPAA